MAEALGIADDTLSQIQFVGGGTLPSIYSVSDLAAAAVAIAGAATTELMAAQGDSPSPPQITVDRRLASLWFRCSIRPQGWKLPAPWDPIAGDYRTSDGWIRLHTNAAHHRKAALSVLQVPGEKAAVAAAVAIWNAEALETAIVDARGCAAAMRDSAAWSRHPQGQSVANESLLALRMTSDEKCMRYEGSTARPLQGIRVLDLTRVLAGPVATRFLAGLGADVLRIDASDWEEPGVVPDVTLGKRCARLDLRDSADREVFHGLLHQAHVLVHGYRADALDRLGLNSGALRKLRPGLIDVALDAYGWSGPWRNRRGFDSLLQMSTGIADAGMRRLGNQRPTPLPVQALDHATGYLMAAAALRGLTLGYNNGRGFEARTSLARTAQLLIQGPAGETAEDIGPFADSDWSTDIEFTEFGPAHRLRSPLLIDASPLHWRSPAVRLGSSAAVW